MLGGKKEVAVPLHCRYHTIKTTVHTSTLHPPPIPKAMSSSLHSVLHPWSLFDTWYHYLKILLRVARARSLRLSCSLALLAWSVRSGRTESSEREMISTIKNEQVVSALTTTTRDGSWRFKSLFCPFSKERQERHASKIAIHSGALDFYVDV